MVIRRTWIIQETSGCSCNLVPERICLYGRERYSKECSGIGGEGDELLSPRLLDVMPL